MRFDDWWPEDDEAAQTPAGNLPLAPEGRHTGEILSAEFKPLKFKVCPENQTGTCLVVKVGVPKAQPVEAIVPAQFRGLIERVCRAASVALPARDEDWDERQLVGRTVTIETVHGVGKTGREYVRIDKWHRGPDPLPEAVKRAPARSQTAKAHKEFTETASADDIPF